MGQPWSAVDDTHNLAGASRPCRNSGNVWSKITTLEPADPIGSRPVLETYHAVRCRVQTVRSESPGDVDQDVVCS